MGCRLPLDTASIIPVSLWWRISCVPPQAFESGMRRPKAKPFCATPCGSVSYSGGRVQKPLAMPTFSQKWALFCRLGTSRIALIFEPFWIHKAVFPALERRFVLVVGSRGTQRSALICRGFGGGPAEPGPFFPGAQGEPIRRVFSGGRVDRKTFVCRFRFSFCQDRWSRTWTEALDRR